MTIRDSNNILPVLVVGADVCMLDWLAQLFGVLGKSVPNWMEAVAEVSVSEYQLVLGNLDRMAGQASLAVGGIRAADRKIRIILCCRPIDEPQARQALAAGADDYLIEPVTRQAFVRTLNGELTLPPTEPPDQVNPPSEPGVTRNSVQAPLAVDLPLQAPSTSAAMEEIPDALGLCDELLQAGKAGTEELLAHAKKLLAKRLGDGAVQLQLLDQPPTGKPRGNQVQHTVQLAHGGYLLLSAGRKGLDQTARQSMSLLLDQAGQLLGTLVDLSRETTALRKLAITDELTGLYNRRYVLQFTEQVLAKARAERFEVTVLLFDVDDFKQYNDTYSHAVGDEVLRETADLMRRCSREHDLVGRFGGDEFVMIFWDAEQRREPNSRHPQTAYALSDRFRLTVSAHDYKCLGPAARGTLTISGGLASFPWDAATVDSLFAKADEALLKAKDSGKNRIYIVGREESR